jgi:hypothetical protein
MAKTHEEDAAAEAMYVVAGTSGLPTTQSADEGERRRRRLSSNGFLKC